MCSDTADTMHHSGVNLKQMEIVMSPRNSTSIVTDENMMAVYDELIRAYNSGTILTFIVLMLGLIANVTLLWSLLANADPRSRLRPFLINLALADLMVCCFTIATELGWRLTVTWIAGDFFCRFLSFTKTLGLYLEAFVVLAMSIDRCYVVLWPLRISGQLQRTQIFLSMAWIAAILFSLPQAIVFHVEYHPDYHDFAQCVTINSFPSPAVERSYVIFSILAMYVVPLIIILIVSLILLWTIRSPNTQLCRVSGTSTETLKVEYIDPSMTHHTSTHLLTPSSSLPSRPGSIRIRLNTGLQLCHTDTIIRKRARSRTLKLSMLIVLAFILCYTPYAVMICMALIVQDSHKDDDDYTSQLTDGLLMLSLSFSTIMNPLVYGSYMIFTRKGWRWQDAVNCLLHRRSSTGSGITITVT